MDPALTLALVQLAAALLQSGTTAVQQLLAAQAAGGDLTELEAIYDRVCAANDILMGNAPASPGLSLTALHEAVVPPVEETEPETPAPAVEPPAPEAETLAPPEPEPETPLLETPPA